MHTVPQHVPHLLHLIADAVAVLVLAAIVIALHDELRQPKADCFVPVHLR